MRSSANRSTRRHPTSRLPAEPYERRPRKRRNASKTRPATQSATPLASICDWLNKKVLTSRYRMAYPEAQDTHYDEISEYARPRRLVGLAQEASMDRSSLFKGWVWRLLAVVAVVLGGASAAPARAATAVTYVSATGHYMRGAFRDFWDKNGGIANFGYPLTGEYFDPKT